MSEIVYLSDVRLSFPALAEPQKNKQYPDKPASYNCDFIFDSEQHLGWQQFMQRVAVMANEKWKEHTQTVMQMIGQDRKLRCFGPGSEKINQKTLKVWDGYVGKVFISANKYADKGMPQMIRDNGQPVDPTNLMEYQAVARKMFGGCRVNAAVKPWLQQNSHGRAVRCDLIAVQFLRGEGPGAEPFGDAHADTTGLFGQVAGAPAAAPAGAMPGFFGATPAAAPAMPAPPTFGAPATMPSFFGT